MPALSTRSPTFIILALVTLATTIYLLTARDPTPTLETPGNMAAFEYETVPGIFRQSDSATDVDSYDYTQHNFGLLPRDYSFPSGYEGSIEGETQWQRLERWVHALNAKAREGATGESWKVVYAGRHGEGFHNVAEAQYGTQAWDDYWSKLDGDGTLFWSDSHLTDLGRQQALDANAFLKKQFMEAQMPAPETYYASPLYRCLQTANFTYAALDVPATRPFRPTVKEMLREVMGEHTCDRRGSRTIIAELFPAWRIEDGFSEDDALWQADHRETFAEHDVRTRALLDDVFAHDEHAFVSFTSHSGATASLLRVVGHRTFKLPTGALMPVLIKATRQN